MDISKEFERYMAHLTEGLGHADWHAGLNGYCTGLMLPLSRKSDPRQAAPYAPHHSLHAIPGMRRPRQRRRRAGFTRAFSGPGRDANSPNAS